MISLHTLELILQGMSVVVLALLFSTVIGAAVGTMLAERRNSYRLPFEQSSHVRRLGQDDSS